MTAYSPHNVNPGYTINTNRIAAGACHPERTVPMRDGVLPAQCEPRLHNQH
nr:MAG TPA: hypothetical protein [Caudoviricetes sp.]